LEPLAATYEASTGGIIALGLGQQGWSVSDSITTFTDLSKKAFTKHPPRRFVPSIVDSALKHGQYSTAALEEAFKEAFSEEIFIFGDPKTSEAVCTKAAVVTTNFRGQVTLISNYNRRVSKARK
jgi:hypothetical protein